LGRDTGPGEEIRDRRKEETGAMTSVRDGEILLPLFPLPDLVFFPHTKIPLHVFEPRYRRLVADVMAHDQRFGIVLLRPGFEADYFGAPPVYQCGTMARIEQTRELDDGRYNLIVSGDMRFRIIDEVSREPYRTARIVAQPQVEGDRNAAYAQRTWLTELSRQYLNYLPHQEAVPEIEMAGLEMLTNALVMSLSLDSAEKQRLLELDDIVARAEEVGEELQHRIESLQFLAPFRQEGDPTRN
jgi:Lon protease-like protein